MEAEGMEDDEVADERDEDMAGLIVWGEAEKDGR